VGDAHPTRLRYCDNDSAAFMKLQGLPEKTNPVKAWTDQDKAFTVIAKGIRTVAEHIFQQKASTCIDNTLVPNLQIGNLEGEALASRNRKLELPEPNSQAGAWELAQKQLFM